MREFYKSVFFLVLICVVLCNTKTLKLKRGEQVPSASVVKIGNQFFVVKGVNTSAVAYGTFQDGLNTTGWGILSIQTNRKYSDIDQMYAAGFLEGALTFYHIYPNYLNLFEWNFGSRRPTKSLLNWLAEQNQWMRIQIATNSSDYWKQVSFIIAQFDGLHAGYNLYAPEDNSLDIFAFQFLNGIGDFFDLIPATNRREGLAEQDWRKLSPEEFKKAYYFSGHCSAIVKVTPDFGELYSSHSSWFTYTSTNRIYKNYYFDLSAPFVSAKKLSFSSYPGFLVSLDDFYIMGNGLVMIQTTNGIFNTSLYDLVKPTSLLAWTRVRIANSMASNGREWKEFFSIFNSGTYVNQYMVVDYNRFVPGKELKEGTLWVVEQIPGLVVGEDLTDLLRFGYWPSYNVPYFPEIFNKSGYPDVVKLFGVGYTHELAPRAQIFRRDQAKVLDLPSLQKLMRSNNYKTDPISKGDPMDAICSRGDIGKYGSPDGCYDTKVTSSVLAAQQSCYAINGPTRADESIPPFSWDQGFSGFPHRALPNTYDFDFIFIKFTNITSSSSYSSPLTFN